MNKSQKVVTVFLSIVFLLFFLKLLHYEILASISILWYTIIIIPTWIVLSTFLIVLFIKLFKTSKKTALLLFLAACIAYMPLDNVYESIRFSLLRSKMESVAIEVAAKYQHEEIPHTFGFKLPVNVAHLSRGGTVNLYLNQGDIQISFYKCEGLMEYSEQYIFDTKIQYQGDNKKKHLYNLDSESIRRHKVFSPNWYFVVTG